MPTTDPDKLAELHRELHHHLPSDPELRVRALESLLLEKGLVDSAAVERFIESYQNEIGRQNGVRAVSEPRGVLQEFGLELGPEVELRVWDSTAVTRYLVLPERPADTHATTLMIAEKAADLILGKEPLAPLQVPVYRAGIA